MSRIIQLLNAIGVKQVSQQGVCYGIAHSAIHHALCNNFKTWHLCLKTVERYPTWALQFRMENARTRRILNQQQAPPYMTLPPWRKLLERFIIFFAGKIEDEVLNDIYNFLQEIHGYMSADSDPFFADTTISHVQKPQSYKHLDQLAPSKKIMKHEGNASARMDNPNTFTALLQTLEQQSTKIQDKNQEQRIAFKLSLQGHACALLFHPDSKTWSAINHDLVVEAKSDNSDLFHALFSEYADDQNLVLYQILPMSNKSFSDHETLHETLESTPQATSAFTRSTTLKNVSSALTFNHPYSLDILRTYIQQKNSTVLSRTMPTLIYATLKNKNIELIKLLLEKGANPNLTIPKMSALKMAIYEEQTEFVRLLLEYGANPSSEDYDNAWMKAVKSNNFEIVRLLYDKKINKKIPQMSMFTYTILSDALKKDDGNLAEIVREILPTTDSRGHQDTMQNPPNPVSASALHPAITQTVPSITPQEKPADNQETTHQSPPPAV